MGGSRAPASPTPGHSLWTSRGTLIWTRPSEAYVIPGFQGGVDSFLSSFWDSGTAGLTLGTASPVQGLGQSCPPVPTPTRISILGTAS